eukprot:scaffold139759_cov22-Tisochrysis_lutea.AAC.1
MPSSSTELDMAAAFSLGQRVSARSGKMAGRRVLNKCTTIKLREGDVASFESRDERVNTKRTTARSSAAPKQDLFSHSFPHFIITCPPCSPFP